MDLPGAIVRWISEEITVVYGPRDICSVRLSRSPGPPHGRVVTLMFLGRDAISLVDVSAANTDREAVSIGIETAKEHLGCASLCGFMKYS